MYARATGWAGHEGTLAASRSTMSGWSRALLRYRELSQWRIHERACMFPQICARGYTGGHCKSLAAGLIWNTVGVFGRG